MQPRLRMLLFGLLRKGSDVDEVLQETLVKLVEAERRRPADIENVQGFVFVVARNAALDWLRHRNSKCLKLGASAHDVMLADSTEDLLDMEQRLRLLQRAMETLPAPARDVLRLQRNEQLTYRQIASRLGLSERQVKMHLQQAIACLARKVKGTLRTSE
jgi:RNA polymerase sigma-70 factor (ECF subfamily)